VGGSLPDSSVSWGFFWAYGSYDIIATLTVVVKFSEVVS